MCRAVPWPSVQIKTGSNEGPASKISLRDQSVQRDHQIKDFLPPPFSANSWPNRHVLDAAWSFEKGEKGFFPRRLLSPNRNHKNPREFFSQFKSKPFRIVPIVFSTRCKPQSFTEPANGHCTIRGEPLFRCNPSERYATGTPTEKHPRGHVCIVYLLCAQPDCVGRSRPWTGRVGAKRIVFLFSSVTISTDCFVASGGKENGTRRAERWIVSICQFPETFWQTPGNSLLVDVMWFGGALFGTLTDFEETLEKIKKRNAKYSFH